ncbi:CBL-interacting kinase 4-like protein [Labeo rohita]|uniref:CBL-interacting kinase 4-like protein n=1 Tax=Labeo rohita TaxID=84645 RepID=A0A498MU89_LABRO|nr:CBL-interacting kinase 4-like protein [Labeo rohita]
MLGRGVRCAQVLSLFLTLARFPLRRRFKSRPLISIRISLGQHGSKVKNFELEYHNITTWFGNSTMQDRRALQRVVRSAERTIRIKLPDLYLIYNKRCWTKARKIVKDLSHPNNVLFSLLRSGKRFRSLRTNTDRLRRSFFSQAIRIL